MIPSPNRISFAPSLRGGEGSGNESGRWFSPSRMDSTLAIGAALGTSQLRIEFQEMK
jgi:hypothetical protein